MERVRWVQLTLPKEVSRTVFDLEQEDRNEVVISYLDKKKTCVMKMISRILV